MDNTNALLRVFSALRFMGMDPNYMARAAAPNFAHVDNPGQVPFNPPDFGHTGATVDNPGNIPFNAPDFGHTGAHVDNPGQIPFNAPPLPHGAQPQLDPSHFGVLAHLAGASRPVQGAGSIQSARQPISAGTAGGTSWANATQRRPPPVDLKALLLGAPTNTRPMGVGAKRVV